MLSKVIPLSALIPLVLFSLPSVASLELNAKAKVEGGTDDNFLLVPSSEDSVVTASAEAGLELNWVTGGTTVKGDLDARHTEITKSKLSSQSEYIASVDVGHQRRRFGVGSSLRYRHGTQIRGGRLEPDNLSGEVQSPDLDSGLLEDDFVRTDKTVNPYASFRVSRSMTVVGGLQFHEVSYGGDSVRQALTDSKQLSPTLSASWTRGRDVFSLAARHLDYEPESGGDVDVSTVLLGWRAQRSERFSWNIELGQQRIRRDIGDDNSSLALRGHIMLKTRQSSLRLGVEKSSASDGFGEMIGFESANIRLETSHTRKLSSKVELNTFRADAPRGSRSIDRKYAEGSVVVEYQFSRQVSADIRYRYRWLDVTRGGETESHGVYLGLKYVTLPFRR